MKRAPIVPAPAPGADKAFRYKGEAAPDKGTALNRPRGQVDPELLTRVVQGQKASDLEERFARGLDRNPNVYGYEFQPSYVTGRNLPGELRPDFIVYEPIMQPVQIDGEFSHKTAEQHASDAVKDALLDEVLKGSGALPSVRIPGYKLQTASDVDEVMRELLLL